MLTSPSNFDFLQHGPHLSLGRNGFGVEPVACDDASSAETMIQGAASIVTVIVWMGEGEYNHSLPLKDETRGPEVFMI